MSTKKILSGDTSDSRSSSLYIYIQPVFYLLLRVISTIKKNLKLVLIISVLSNVIFIFKRETDKLLFQDLLVCI